MEEEIFAFLKEQRFINAKVKREIAEKFNITADECLEMISKFYDIIDDKKPIKADEAAAEAAANDAAEPDAAAEAAANDAAGPEAASEVAPEAASEPSMPVVEKTAGDDSSTEDDSSSTAGFGLSPSSLKRRLSSSALSSSNIFVESDEALSDEVSSFGLGAKAVLESSKQEDIKYGEDLSSVASSSSSSSALATGAPTTFYDIDYEDLKGLFEALISKHGTDASKDTISSFFKEKKLFSMRGLVIFTLVKYYEAINTSYEHFKTLWESDHSKKRPALKASPAPKIKASAASYTGTFTAPRGQFKKQDSSAAAAAFQQQQQVAAMMSMQQAMQQQFMQQQQQFMQQAMKQQQQPPHSSSSPMMPSMPMMPMMPSMMPSMMMPMMGPQLSSPISPSESSATSIPYFNPYWPFFGYTSSDNSGPSMKKQKN